MRPIPILFADYSLTVCNHWRSHKEFELCNPVSNFGFLAWLNAVPEIALYSGIASTGHQGHIFWVLPGALELPVAMTVTFQCHMVLQVSPESTSTAHIRLATIGSH